MELTKADKKHIDEETYKRKPYGSKEFGDAIDTLIEYVKSHEV